jgi:hypothetical protein
VPPIRSVRLHCGCARCTRPSAALEADRAQSTAHEKRVQTLTTEAGTRAPHNRGRPICRVRLGRHPAPHRALADAARQAASVEERRSAQLIKGLEESNRSLESQVGGCTLAVAGVHISLVLVRGHFGATVSGAPWMPTAGLPGVLFPPPPE